MSDRPPLRDGVRDDVEASFRAHPSMVEPFVAYALALTPPASGMYGILSRVVSVDKLCEAFGEGSENFLTEAEKWLVANRLFRSFPRPGAEHKAAPDAEEAESNGPDTDVLEEKLWDLPSAWLCDLATDVSKDESNSGVRTLCLAATLCLKKRPKIEVLSEALYQGGVPFRKRVKTWVDEHQLPREDGDQ